LSTWPTGGNVEGFPGAMATEKLLKKTEQTAKQRFSASV
jgi:hypothetical protein